jgi:hypothetical protein
MLLQLCATNFTIFTGGGGGGGFQNAADLKLSVTYFFQHEELERMRFSYLSRGVVGHR